MFKTNVLSHSERFSKCALANMTESPAGEQVLSAKWVHEGCLLCGDANIGENVRRFCKVPTKKGNHVDGVIIG